MSFIRDDEDIPAHVGVAPSGDRHIHEEIYAALRDIQTYLRAGVLDANTTLTVRDIDLILSTDPAAGPEMDFGGARGRWFIGIDTSNADTSRDFVLAGQRGTYSFTDGVTTSGSATLTSASKGGFTSALVGSPITGAGIPAGTTISAFVSATNITMSANATATATGVTVTITRSTSADVIYIKHRGALSPTIGFGITPQDGSAPLQVSPNDAEVAMGTMRLRRGPSQTGDVLTIHDSTPVDRLKVDKDFYLTGNHPTTNGGVAIAADATNQHALQLTDSTHTNFYAFDLPTGSGGVLRIRCQSGGASCCDIGTNGSFRHLSTQLGFYGASTITKPAVTGSRGGNAALASLITALANLGLVTDSTTA